MTVIPDELKDNPLLHDWRLTGGLPNYAALKPEHFEPALRFAMATERAEIKAITAQKEKPTFENTILAFERTGDLLDQVGSVFNSLAGVMSNKVMQKLEKKLHPLLSRHSSWVFQNTALFKRVDKVFSQRAELDAVKRRLVETIHKSFVDSGAQLSPADKKRLADIQAEEAALGTKFDTNRTNQVAKPVLVLSTEAELAGLPQFLRDSAKETARATGHKGKYAFLCTGTDTNAFLTYSSRRDLREQLFTAHASRNDRGDEFDNKATCAKLLALAAESARMLGYSNPAQMYLKDNMIKNPENAEALLHQSWDRTVVAYNNERKILQEAAAAEGMNEPLQPWDWKYYAQQVREKHYKLDDAELKPYLSLDNVRDAAFAAANKLWGITFKKVEGARLYHPDAELFEVCEADGTPVGKFIGDYFARAGDRKNIAPAKQQGAWMGELRTQYSLDGGQQPIVYNVCNISKASEGQPTLLSLEEAQTLFHEMGHGLHGLLSKVEYPTLAGCNGPMDYVELPSQIFEKFLLSNDILRQHLRHFETGAPMPAALIEKLKASENFCRGHDTMEYLASAVVDLALYRLPDASGVDFTKFEQDTLKQWGLPEGGYMRHRLAHFSHIFGGGYPASYHSYEQAAVLDTDGYAAFEEKGDSFHQPTAARLRREVYASGASRDPLESYIAFRGRAPQMDALFKSRGFTPA